SRFVCWSYFSNDFVDVQGFRNGLGRTMRITREHHDTKAIRSEGFESHRGALLDRVSHDDRTRERAFDGHEHHRSTGAPRAVHGPLNRLRRRTDIRHERDVAESQPPAVVHAGDTAACLRSKVVNLRGRDAAGARALDDGTGERMLARALEAGCECEELVFFP